jgi:ubiquinone/menaquinone biosynthesis C-methylase UbiE
MAAEFAGRKGSLHLVAVDAAHIGFRDRTFDLTLCIQSGISAFGADQSELFSEAVRVTRSGGRVLFSTYCERFWEERLKWFQIQAVHGLIGEIDYHATGNGVIVRSTSMWSNGVLVFMVQSRRVVTTTEPLPGTSVGNRRHGSLRFCRLP